MNARRIIPAILFFALLAPGVRAQAPIEGPQLPARTSFYLLWRGFPAADARKGNSLLSLWDDPDFAPVRAAMAEGLMNDTKKSKDKPGLTREEVALYATLLDNPFTLGYLPRREGAATKSATAKEPLPTWNGMFFVYDRTGKEELLSKAVLRMRSTEPEIPKIEEVTLAGVKALKVQRKNSTTYWAETGKYAVAASELSVFEDVLNRLTGKGTGASLGESEAFREAKPLLAAGLLEFFLRVPQIRNITGDPDAATPQVKQVWNSLKLDSLHVFAGHISIDGPRTRLQGGILGDTAEGSLFDIWPAGQTNPVSLAYVTPETIYYTESEISLLGIYKVINRVLAAPGSNMAPMVGALEGMAQTRIGMTLPEAFALTTGEFGTVQTSPSMDPDKRIFFAGIQNKPDFLKLARTTLSDRITSERNDGNVTFLKISLQGDQGSKGVAQWSFYHLALTPDLLLGASKIDTLKQALMQPAAGSDLSLPKTLQAARAQFPTKLTGFSYFDLQKLDWPAVQQRWTAQMVKSAADSKNVDAEKRARQVNDWMTNVNPAVFSRHLHSMTGASWKDANGVHFDQWID
jgi:hypothetical protein